MCSEATTCNAGGVAENLAVTAFRKADAWAPPMAAEALLIRGNLALLDGKLRVGDAESHELHGCFCTRGGVYASIMLSEVLESIKRHCLPSTRGHM